MSNGNIVSLDDVNMPYSLEAEQAVLGSILIEPSCITQVLILVKPEYFYLPQHKAIFTIMQELDALGNKIDPLIVLEKLKSEIPTAKLILQVHDELIVECDKNDAEKVCKLLEEEMEKSADLAVKLTADSAFGKNWLEAKG